MRYLKRQEDMYRSPNGDGFAKLAPGTAVRLIGGRDGDLVQVQAVDARGRATGQPGWISAGHLKKPDPVVQGTRVRFGGRELFMDPVGAKILSGDVSCDSGYCARTYTQAGGAFGGDANDMIPKFQKSTQWRELTNEPPRAGDVAVWKHYGNNSRTRGWRYGHVGVIALDAQGRPWLVSNFEGKRDVRKLNNNGHLYIFRRVR